MENDALRTEQDERWQRKRELDEALASGALTLTALHTLNPTTTTPEHHQELRRALSAQERPQSGL